MDVVLSVMKTVRLHVSTDGRSAFVKIETESNGTLQSSELSGVRSLNFRSES